jgi:Leucine rich repeat N-terminal domain
MHRRPNDLAGIAGRLGAGSLARALCPACVCHRVNHPVGSAVATAEPSASDSCPFFAGDRVSHKVPGQNDIGSVTPLFKSETPVKSSKTTSPILRRACTSFVAALLSLLALANAAFAAVPNSEYLLLRAIYDGTDGSRLWTRKNGWVENNSADVCTWYGVICNAAGTHVTEIDLSANFLNGTLPPTLVGFSELTRFRVPNNLLTGSIPQISGLQELALFQVDDNSLKGRIPAFENLPKLRAFVASKNLLTGRIPDLSGAPLLETFQAERNFLTGAIPPLAALSRLNSFSVNSNRLTGALPELSGLTALTSIHVANNALSGTLPVPPGSLTPNGSKLCPNQFTDSQSNVWNTAVTGSAMMSWHTGCIPPLIQLSLSFGAPPVLTSGGFGQVIVTASPPGSSSRVQYGSVTPSVCTVENGGIPRVDVSPSAPVGAVCTITADMAGDTNFNSAPQVQQDIVIAAAESPVSSVPALNPWAMLALVSWLAAIGAMFRRVGARRTRETLP